MTDMNTRVVYAGKVLSKARISKPRQREKVRFLVNFVWSSLICYVITCTGLFLYGLLNLYVNYFCLDYNRSFVSIGDV